MFSYGILISFLPMSYIQRVCMLHVAYTSTIVELFAIVSMSNPRIGDAVKCLVHALVLQHSCPLLVGLHTCHCVA